jgi:hypothetical protein
MEGNCLQQSDLVLNVLARVTRLFIGQLVCCLRSLNGMHQREAVLLPWYLHRVSGMQSFLDIHISTGIYTETFCKRIDVSYRQNKQLKSST